VSIYNENFSTTVSKEPYFIKVHRCIIACRKIPFEMPIAITQKEIEIVVADINNQANSFMNMSCTTTLRVDVIESQRTSCTRILFLTKVG
jgi:hypothetical protein